MVDVALRVGGSVGDVQKIKIQSSFKLLKSAVRPSHQQ
jgi:hypothetical protein